MQSTTASKVLLPVICPSCSAAVCEDNFRSHWQQCKPRHWSRRGEIPPPAREPSKLSDMETAELSKVLSCCEESWHTSRSRCATVTQFLRAVLRHRLGVTLSGPAEAENLVFPCGPAVFGVVTTVQSLSYRFEAAAPAGDRMFVSGVAKHLECVMGFDVTVQGSTIIAQPPATAAREGSLWADSEGGAKESDGDLWSLLVQHAPMITIDVLKENCPSAVRVALAEDEKNFVVSFSSEEELLDVLAKGSLPLRTRGQHSHAILRGMSPSTQRRSIVAQSTITVSFDPSWERPLTKLVSSCTLKNPNVQMTIVLLSLWLRSEVIFVRPTALAVSSYQLSLMVIYALFRMSTVEWPVADDEGECDAGPGRWKLNGVMSMVRRVFDFYGDPDEKECGDALQHSQPFGWDAGEVIQLICPVRAYAKQEQAPEACVSDSQAKREHRRLMMLCEQATYGSPSPMDLSQEWLGSQTKRLHAAFSRGRRMLYGGQLGQQLKSFAAKAAEISEGACVACGSSNVVSGEVRGPRQRCDTCSKMATSAGVVRQAFQELAREQELVLCAALVDILDG